ncbi:MAG: carbon-nitrogen family hydrolase [Planctomycetota bacterium]|nr:MAG: carbon-nitrogen family hydrolase [Planctomycetota bacterium]
MQIVACQTDIVWEDKPANHERVADMLRDVAIDRGALVILPEMFAVGFSMNAEALAENHEGPTHTFLRELAQEKQVFVFGGVVTRTSGTGCRNEAVVFGPEGQVVARYAKTHPFTLAGENDAYEAGSDVTTFSWGEFTVAPFICYDLRFPEVFRRAVRRGADLMVVVASWPQVRQAHWAALLRARAIENQCYVVGVNRVGTDPNTSYAGGSVVVAFDGETLAEADDGAQVLVAEIERGPLVEFRQKLPFLADIREEFVP